MSKNRQNNNNQVNNNIIQQQQQQQQQITTDFDILHSKQTELFTHNSFMDMNEKYQDQSEQDIGINNEITIINNNSNILKNSDNDNHAIKKSDKLKIQIGNKQKLQEKYLSQQSQSFLYMDQNDSLSQSNNDKTIQNLKQTILIPQQQQNQLTLMTDNNEDKPILSSQSQKISLIKDNKDSKDTLEDIQFEKSQKDIIFLNQNNRENNTKKPSLNKNMSLRTYFQAKQIARKLKTKSTMNLQLKEKVLNIINDLAGQFQIIDEDIKTNIWQLGLLQKISLCAKAMFKFINVSAISPDNTYRLCWDIFQVILIMGIFIANSIGLVFDFDLDDAFYRQNWTRQIILIIFIFHILLTFNTGFYHKGVQILNHKRIMKKYGSENFLPDLVSVVPFMVQNKRVLHTNGFLIVELLMYFKLFTLIRIYKRLNNVAEIRETSQGIIKLTKLLFFLLVLAHVEALLFFAIGQIEIKQWDYTNTWLHADNLLELTWWEQYIKSFYWSSSAMITVVVYIPVTIPETIFSCIVFQTTTGIFGYSINIIQEIMSEMYKREKEYQKQRETINRYMNKKDFSFQLRVKVRNYLDYIQQENLSKTTREEQEVIECLSQQLREEVLKEERWDIIQKIQILYKNFSEKSLQRMMYYMEEVVLSEGEILFLDNQIDDLSLYFIVKGSVDLFYECYRSQEYKGTVVKSIDTQEECFGEYGFFTGTQRLFSARSTDYTTVYKIRRDDFLNIIIENDIDFENFHMIKDQLLQSHKQDMKYIKCDICNSVDHIERNCPSVHYIPEKLEVVKKIKAAQNEFERRQRSINDNIKNQEVMKEFREDYASLINVDDDNNISLDEIQQENSKSVIQEIDETEEDTVQNSQADVLLNTIKLKKNKSNFSSYNTMNNNNNISNNSGNSPLRKRNSTSQKDNVSVSTGNMNPQRKRTEFGKKTQMNRSKTGFQQQQFNKKKPVQKQFYTRYSKRLQPGYNFYDELVSGINQKLEKDYGKIQQSNINMQIPKWVAKTYKEKQLQNRRGSMQFMALKQLEQMSSINSSSRSRNSNFGIDITIEDMAQESLQQQQFAEINNNNNELVSQKSINNSKFSLQTPDNIIKRSPRVSDFKRQQELQDQQQQYEEQLQQKEEFDHSNYNLELYFRNIIYQYFDYIREYKYYFTHGNATVVIQKIQMVNEKNMREMIRKNKEKKYKQDLEQKRKQIQDGTYKQNSNNLSKKFQQNKNMGQSFAHNSNNKVNETEPMKLQFGNKRSKTASNQ